MEYVTTLLGQQKPATTATDKDPNVLALTNNNNYTSGWFPLLPIILSSNAKTLTIGKVPNDDEKVGGVDFILLVFYYFSFDLKGSFSA